MSSFAYKAVNTQGHAKAGVVDAPSRVRAVNLLAEQGVFVTQIDEADAASAAGWSLNGLNVLGGGTGRVTVAQRAAVLQQLSVALEAGLPLLDGLEVVRDQAPNDAVYQLADELMQKVQTGDALSSAMESMGSKFTQMQVSMVRAGEAAGVLDKVMRSLAEFAERDLEVRQKLKSASVYPLMVLCLGVVSIVIVVTFIIPNILSTVTASGGELPLPTRILMGTSELARSPMGIGAALLLVVLIVWGVVWSRTEDGRFKVDQIKLKLPVIGTAVRKASVARFARTLGTLTSAGIQIVEAMQIVRGTMGNEVLARAVDESAAQIIEGQSITEPLRASGQFPKLLVQVIAMGEKTGRLDQLLLKTAESYEKETTAALDRVMSVIPAFLILMLALVVGFILAAAMLPIMTMDMG